jgi:hypothetical protein
MDRKFKGTLKTSRWIAKLITGSIFLTLLILSVLGPGLSVKPVAAEGNNENTITLKFDVAEDNTRFKIEREPVRKGDQMTYRLAFTAYGYIYKADTLDGSSGVLPNGQAEFPDKVIGEWTSRGYFTSDNPQTEAGLWVMSTHVYNFGDESRKATLVTEGYESTTINESVRRKLIKGTGDYSRAGGKATQKLLGINASGGVNLHLVLTFELNQKLRPRSVDD